MRYFLIDDLRAEETKRLCEHLDAMDLGAGLDGIYWLPIPAHMLSAVQKEHESQCGPYVMALECEETSLRLELLVRARGRIRCECVAYASPELQRCLDVERFCRHSLKMADGDTWLLAVSGGADSTALLCIMALLAPQHDWQLHVATVDHQLRPESAEDAAFVAGLCRGWRIPCRILTADVPRLARQEGLGTEEAARRARYALLKQARQACGATAILLGHHRSDVTEDQMLRFLRGTGWPALGGMRAEDAERHLLRPLLRTDKHALKELLHCCGILWREDASNADTRYTRNRLRHTLLPLLRQENPRLEDSCLNLWELAGIDGEYWQQELEHHLARTPWQEAPGSITLPRALLRGTHAALRLRLYHRAVARLARLSGRQARSATPLGPDQAWHGGRGGTTFQLPGSIMAHLKGGSIRFYVEKRQAVRKS